MILAGHHIFKPACHPKGQAGLKIRYIANTEIIEATVPKAAETSREYKFSTPPYWYCICVYT
jgi:hypothetical protein